MLLPANEAAETRATDDAHSRQDTGDARKNDYKLFRESFIDKGVEINKS